MGEGEEERWEENDVSVHGWVGEYENADEQRFGRGWGFLVVFFPFPLVLNSISFFIFCFSRCK